MKYNPYLKYSNLYVAISLIIRINRPDVDTV